MIIDFTVKNFRSFSEINSISFTDKSKKNATRPLNFAAIYGANASGKSNIMKALDYVRFAMQNIDVVNKLTVSHPLLQPFLLDEESAQKPSFFEMTLQDVDKDIIYRYGFEVTRNEVVSEWLIENAFRGSRRTEREIFTREKQAFQFGQSVPRRVQLLAENVNEVVLALPYFANSNYDTALAVANLLISKLAIFDSSNTDMMHQIAYQTLDSKPELKDRVVEVIRHLDWSIENIDVEMKPVTVDELVGLPDQLKPLMSQANGLVNTRIQTSHNLYDKLGVSVGHVKFGLENESLGTQKVIPLITMLLEAIEQDLIVVLDEFGSSLHPFISKALVDLFGHAEHNAQLLVITHETYLLTQNMNLDPSQLWFVEKNRREQSKLVSLADYSPKDSARLDKQYLEGRFGAVPIVFKVNN